MTDRARPHHHPRRRGSARPLRRDQLQRARRPAQPHRERLGADRRAAQAALRPHPQPGRDREGLRVARAGDARRRPQGQPELRPAARGADGHRGPHRLRAAVLQRHRLPLQHEDPELPGQRAGRRVPVLRARVLPGRRRVPRADAGQLLSALAERLLPGPDRSVFDQVTSNKRRSWLLVAGFVVFVALVASAFAYLVGGGPIGFAVALAVAAATSFGAYWKSDAVALRMSRARPAPVAEFARYHNIVEGLCIASGLPKPRLYVVDDPAPNAFATGRNPRNAAVAVTTGLLEKLNRIELEGVVAHELSHVKNYVILVSTLAVTMVGVVALLADIGVRMMWWGMGRHANSDYDRDHGGNGGPQAILSILGFALLALGPVIAIVMQRTISRRRETLADVSGVEMTRYPPGLISALEKLREDSTVVHATSHATAHLWIEQPAAQTRDEGRLSRFNRMFDTHPPIEERIALLREL